MLQSVVDELGEAAIAKVIEPLKRLKQYRGPVLGFDTEYVSETGAFLSFQLASGDKSGFYTERMTVDSLARRVREFVGLVAEEVYLVSYFSLAELQFLPVKMASFNWREYGAGSFDCSFRSQRHGLTLHIFDLARFFDRQSLAKVAETFGLEKLAWQRDKVTKADLKKKAFREYAINDAILAYKITASLREEFVTPYDIDPLAYKTPASTAAAVFRATRVRSDLYCDNNRARLAGMRSCWGGRAEVFFRGVVPRVYEYDLNSAYPAAAIALGEMPIQGSWKEVNNVKSIDRYRAGYARVVFAFPAKCRFPCLPVILPEAQLYPLEGSEWVTFHEIRLAREMGATVRILEGYGYKRGTRILADFLSGVLAERTKAKGARKVALKLLANSLIGKLAQRVSDIDLEELRQAAEDNDILIDDLAAMTRDEIAALGISPNVNVGSLFMPEWNALITGYTRAQIGRLIADTEAVYAATDAVWTRNKLKTVPPGMTLKRTGEAVIARTRLASIVGKDGEHIAHHSIWTKDAARDALADLNRGPFNYSLRRPIKLRESITKRKALGTWVKETRTAWAFWDWKRKLLPSGETLPWSNVDEFLTARKQAAKERKYEKDEKRKAGNL